MKIPQFKPIFNEEMEKEAIRVLKEEYFINGKSVRLFEEEFADYIGVKHAIAVSSCSEALVIAIQSLGIKDKAILTTPTTFISTAECIKLTQNILSFNDIDSKTYNLPEIINVDGQAIIPVHLYGLPYNMHHILMQQKKKGFNIIEDCAQAIGATIDGKKVGTFGDIGCFSFHTTKNMNVCGKGGMIVTNEDKYADDIRKLRYHGGVNLSDMSKVEFCGYNAQLNTVNASIGRVQLRYLDEWNEKRRSIARFYHKNLANIDGLQLPVASKGHVYHQFVIRLDKRDSLKQFLAEKGIQTIVHYTTPIHLIKPYTVDIPLPEAEYHAKHCLSLPMFPELKKEEVEYVCEGIKSYFEENK